MTKAMPFLQKAILLSYDPRRFGQGGFFCAAGPLCPGMVPYPLAFLLPKRNGENMCMFMKVYWRKKRDQKMCSISFHSA